METLVSKRPSAWLGRPLEWLKDDAPRVVFIDAFQFSNDQRTVFLFGAKYDTTEVLVGGRTYGQGHFAEYFVVVAEANGWCVRRLMQQGSVTYSEVAEKGDFLMVAEASLPRDLGSPRWKPAGAAWPTVGGKPMSFIGQAFLEENEVTRSFLSWDETVFLFSASVDGRDCFKIVDQAGTVQTEEEHYLLEIEMSGKRKRSKRTPRNQPGR